MCNDKLNTELPLKFKKVTQTVPGSCSSFPLAGLCCIEGTRQRLKGSQLQQPELIGKELITREHQIPADTSKVPLTCRVKPLREGWGSLQKCFQKAPALGQQGDDR